jgi:NTE family protein
MTAPDTDRTDHRPRIAFVLGGGGVMGAVEVGMLRALEEAGIVPDIILGTSVGALNGALVAADPSPGVIDRLVALWESAAGGREVYGEGPVRQVTRAVRTGTHLHSAKPLCQLQRGSTTSPSAVARSPVLCGERRAGRRAAGSRRAGWSTVVASAAMPGLLGKPSGRPRLDGGIVLDPRGPGSRLQPSVIYVLGGPGRPATRRAAVEVARVSFEIARRHRFHREMAELPPHVRAHVLPTGGTGGGDDSLLSYRDFSAVLRRIDAAYEATKVYLKEHTP